MLQETEEMKAPKAQSAFGNSLTAEKRKNNELCAIWEAKLKAVPLFDGNHHNAKGLLQQKQYFLQAKELMTEFEKIDFPVRICYSLESIARDLQMGIFTFPYNLNKTAKFLAKELTRNVEERIYFSNRDADQINDPNQKPYIIDKNELLEFIHQADELKPLFAEDPSQLESLANTINRLKELMTNSEIV